MINKRTHSLIFLLGLAFVLIEMLFCVQTALAKKLNPLDMFPCTDYRAKAKIKVEVIDKGGQLQNPVVDDRKLKVDGVTVKIRGWGHKTNGGKKPASIANIREFDGNTNKWAEKKRLKLPKYFEGVTKKKNTIKNGCITKYEVFAGYKNAQKMWSADKCRKSLRRDCYVKKCKAKPNGSISWVKVKIHVGKYSKAEQLLRPDAKPWTKVVGMDLSCDK